MRQLLPYLGKYRIRLILSILFNFLTAIFTIVSIPLVIPFFQILFGVNISELSPPENIFDLDAGLNYYFSRLIVISDKTTALGFMCIVLLIIVIFRNIFRYLSVYFLIPVRNGVVKDIRNDLVSSYLNMPLREYRKLSKGELLSISSHDVVEVEWSVIRMMELLFKSPILIIGSLILMFWINVKLSLIAIGLMLVVGIVLGGLSKNLKAKSAKTQALMALLNAKVEGIISGIKMIKSFGAASHFEKKFSEMNDEHYKKNNQILRRRDLASPLSELLGVSLVVILVWYGAKMVIAYEMRPEIFFAFIFSFYNVIEPAKSLSTAYYNVQKGLASMERIQAVINIGSKDELPSGNTPMPENWNNIKLENLCYSYEGQKVLSDINLTIPRGKSIAIVGKSGVGKSTLLDMIMRMDDAESGSLTIDNQCVNEIELMTYRENFSFLSQDPILFTGSIEENLSLGKNIENSAILEALKEANADKFIKEKGIYTDLFGNGTNYSMGQRQRIAIARAIAQKRPILVIDEATTALDAESEQLVLSALAKAMRDKTIIMVSHRFSLIKNVDIIYVMQNGKIVNYGTHEELISSDKIYKELLSYQTGL
ncbi:MAG: ABC transporter ATP-binding protein [Saprospiraceae bacterium]